MDYKITCVCGHQFLLPEEKLRGEVYCPACHQRLNPALETPAPTAPAAGDPALTNLAPAAAPAATEPDPEPTKRCPFCGEVILAIARKCKHCGEFLDRADPSAAPMQTAAAPVPNAPAPIGTPAPAPNDPVFSLYTSQWNNFWRYLILVALIVFVIFILWIFPSLHPFFAIGAFGAVVVAGAIGYVVYLSAKTTHILIRPLRIDIEKGILTKKISSMELFRITDVDLQQGILPRLLGFGTIKLATSDTDSPQLTLRLVPHAREVRQYLQTQIPLAARQRGALYMEK